MAKHCNFRLDEKIDILKRNDNSDDIVRELRDTVRQWADHTSDSSLKVTDQPYSVNWEVEVLMEVLDDLRQYTECVKCDSDIPDELEYITPFWTKKDDDYIDEGEIDLDFDSVE